MSIRATGFTSLCWLLAAGCGLQAQATKPSEAAQHPASSTALQDQKALEDLLKVQIISVSKVPQRPIDAPGLVESVSRSQLDAYGWTSLNDVVSSQPGFSLSQDYDRRTLSSRGAYEGWNNDHLLLLVDGVPMNDDIYGSAYTWEIT
ncbi:MAG TPA: Plug domain-containing protein, partial [Holophagaceae bacterium]